MLRRQPRCTLCPYTTLFRSTEKGCERATRLVRGPAMSARSYAGGLALGVVAVAAISSCSFTNDIDACDKSVPASVPVNELVDGNQTLGSSRSVTVVPSGETLVMFDSAPAASPDQREVRGARVTPSGALADGCKSRTEREQVFFPVDLSDPSKQITTVAAVSAPESAMGLADT